MKKIISGSRNTIGRITRTFREFSRSQQFSGVLLIVCTLASLYLANSKASFLWAEIRHYHLPQSRISAEFLVNDVLMALFFLLAGLEIKREFLAGELAGFSRAALPVSAAIGGMIVPALLFSLVTQNTPHQQSWGIPMATDIAFSLGILSLLGNRVPISLKVFLVALAVADDLGAIAVIGFFYTDTFQPLWFLLGMLPVLVMYVLNIKKIENISFYFMSGAVLWYCLLKAGVHPTIAGVVMAFMIPFGKEEENCGLHRLERALHSPVNFFIMPVFALWNTAVSIESGGLSSLNSALALGIMLGLIIGKPAGIFLFSWLSIKLKLGKWPEQCSPLHVLGAGMLGGIGFTMSIFVTLLSVKSAYDIQVAKLAILIASLVSALGGLIFLALLKAPKIRRGE